MKKIFIVMSVAILMALCSAPSFVKADDYTCGQLWYNFQSVDYLVDCYTTSNIVPVDFAYTSRNQCYVMDSGGNIYDLYFRDPNTNTQYTVIRGGIRLGYIPTLLADYDYGGVHIIRDYTTFVNSLPEDLRPELPEPSLAQQRWDAFYEWFKLKHGFYPVDGSLIDLLRKLVLGDENSNTEIVFPTFVPTPTPIPSSTPIPVQTIFVPDGSGNTTIIYQYPDPDTGDITQSPYNPNTETYIDLNCNCTNNSDDGTFSSDPQDPFTLTSSMLWADGSGTQLTENPLTAANVSQQSLADAASDYTSSVNVVSNSFNVLPFKWLTLVGLAGGILIIAGLMRTFLGG